MTTTFRRSPLALAILGLLEVGPLHPYAIQQLIKQWGKDQVVNVGQRASLYKMINRLLDAGLVSVQDTGRDHHYPERTTYEVTDAGRDATRAWLDEILATPRNEFPEFPAALSFVMMLPPALVGELLIRRSESLTRQLAELDASLTTELEGFSLPRVTMLETEYARAVCAAELRWVDDVRADLASGDLTWNKEELEALAAGSQNAGGSDSDPA